MLYLKICLLYEFRLGHSVEEAPANISRTFKLNDKISKSKDDFWFERFRNNNFALDDIQNDAELEFKSSKK